VAISKATTPKGRAKSLCSTLLSHSTLAPCPNENEFMGGTISGARSVQPWPLGASARPLFAWLKVLQWRQLVACSGEQPAERLRVWYHNGEDSLEELNRRLGAICLHYDIPQEELRGWFFMTSGNEIPLRVANGYGELKIHTPLVQAIEGISPQ
jgi:hypothetical protein